MGANAKSMVRGEMMGSIIEIIDSKNKSLIGLKGKVIDETKNSFTIESDGKRKMILKNHVKLVLNKSGKRVLIDGKILTKRPEDRINIKGN